MATRTTLTASQVVARTGIPPATLRYYLRLDLLPAPRRVNPRRFLYDQRHVDAIRLIRALRERRRLSLKTIRRILPHLLARKREGFRASIWDEVLREHGGDSNELLGAAVRVFSRKGYSGTSVEAIADAAGVAKGSVYRTYRSKEDLFFAAAREAATGGVDRALPILLDLTAGALRREPGFRRALARTLREIATGPGGRPSRDGAAVVGSALAEALRDHFSAARRT